MRIGFHTVIDPALGLIARRWSRLHRSASGDCQPLSSAGGSGRLMPPELTELLYELLDAHADTAELGAERQWSDDQWSIHIDYLRSLQRAGRRALAEYSDDWAA